MTISYKSFRAETDDPILVCRNLHRLERQLVFIEPYIERTRKVKQYALKNADRPLNVRIFFCQVFRDVVVECGDDNPVGDTLFPCQFNERIGGASAPFSAVLDVDAVKIFSVRLYFIDYLVKQISSPS